MQFSFPESEVSHQVDVDGYPLCAINRSSARPGETEHGFHVRRHYYELALLKHIHETVECEQVAADMFDFSVPSFLGQEDEEGNPVDSRSARIRITAPNADAALRRFRTRLHAFAMDHFRGMPFTNSDLSYLRHHARCGRVDDIMSFYR